MKTSKTKFVLIFLICAFVFMFVTNTLFGTEARVFPVHEKSFLGTDSSVAWKHAGYEVVYPVKVVLVGPMLFFPDFLHDDPPPPLVGIVFAAYWSVLALVLYCLVRKIRRS